MSLELDNNNINQFRSRVILGQEERPKMLDLILKTGVVKNEKNAANVLITMILIVFALSIFIFMRTYSEPELNQVPIYYPDGTNSSMIQQ